MGSVRDSKTGRFKPVIGKTLRERLESKLRVDPVTGCWEWQGYRMHFGHGQMQRGRRGQGLILTHRAAWEIYRGEDPGDLQVCHHCDNPPCCNPDHLFLGTAQDNISDMMRKGRRRAPRYPRGEEHWKAKLTDDAVIGIRSGALKGVARAELARMFGVSVDTVRLVIRREIWRHVA